MQLVANQQTVKRPEVQILYLPLRPPSIVITHFLGMEENLSLILRVGSI